MGNEELSQMIESVVSSVLHSKTTAQNEMALSNMTLPLAKALIERVEKEASRIGVNAVIAVSNTAARPVAVACMDDSYIASYDIAVNKAFTVVSLKMPTTELKRLAQPGESLYGIQFTNQGQIVIFGGGVPLIFRGTLLGGLGVSGGSEEQDTHLAEFGGAVLEEEIACLYPHLR